MNQPSTEVLTRQPAAQSGTAGPNSIKALQDFGQSVWLDYLRRGLFSSGEFERLIAEDGLRGVTSNPSIFEKAIAELAEYRSAIQELQLHQPMEPVALYEALAIQDSAPPPTCCGPCTTQPHEATDTPASRSRRISRTTRPQRSRMRVGFGKPWIVTTS